MHLRTERGLTLTELTIVMALAALITIGLVTFYLNSQAVWIDASAQSMAQRDGTLLVEEISRRVREAKSATVFSEPDDLHQKLFLFDENFGPAACWFFWSPQDSLIHLNETDGVTGPNPIVSSKVERFEVVRDSHFVYITRLRMSVMHGHPVEVSSTIRMYNSGS